MRRWSAIVMAALFAVAPGADAGEKQPAPAAVSAAQIAEARKLGVPVAFTNGIGMTFVLLPSGTFMMGSGVPAGDVARHCNMPNAQMGWFVDEHPRHEVTLPAFYMSIHEVTQGQYGALVNTNRHPKNVSRELMNSPPEFRGTTKPAIYVGCQDVDVFFALLNKQEAGEGRTYSLPTEAEWEYACRAGTTTPFSFGETLSPDQANYNGEYTYADGKVGTNRGAPVPVGSLPANAWGLYELHGNVAEWCADKYAEYDDGAEPDPKQQDRVLRGGAWRSYPGACRSACRLRAHENRRTSHVGFRVVCSVPAGPEQKKESLP